VLFLAFQPGPLEAALALTDDFFEFRVADEGLVLVVFDVVEDLVGVDVEAEAVYDH
jgi:hypothetical protein